VKVARLHAVFWLGLPAVLAACNQDDGWHGQVVPWPIPVVGTPGSTVPDSGFPREPDGGGPGIADSGFPREPDGGKPDPTLGIFDPEQVYLLGTLGGVSCDRGAIAPVLEPDKVVAGFDCGTIETTTRIRPTDGRLLYMLGERLYVFESDSSSYTSASATRYPASPVENDTVVSTPGCGTRELSAFTVSATGAIYYRCGSDWYDPQHQLVVGQVPTLLQVGADGSALTRQGIHTFARSRLQPGALDASVLGDAGGEDAAVEDAGEASTDAGVDAGTDAGGDGEPELVPFVGLPARGIIASRPQPDGYWVALAGDAIASELWHVDFDGHASQLGVYPAPPGGQQVTVSEAKLDGEGRLFQIVVGGLRDRVIRRSVSGTSEVLYDGDQGPFHISTLVTGS
jgi:hypothetical protein